MVTRPFLTRRVLTVRDWLRERVAGAPATYAFAAASVAALAWVELHGRSTDVATLVHFGALERGRVWSGEPWRLVTATFLHVGWIHLAWNVVAGVPWCRVVERLAGTFAFVLVYLSSAVGASAISLLGQDVVAAGASGALFGIVGATLALHRRGVGSWRAFFGSRATRSVLFAIAAWSVIGGLLLPLDQLAHAGGFAVGAVAAWLLSRPERRVLPWAAFGAALAALVVAACWPRGEMSHLQEEEAGQAADAAVKRGDLEGAQAIARRLLGSSDAGVRDRARRFAVEGARTLGYRYYTGDGATRDPRRGLEYFEEACALGDAKGCEIAGKIRGR